MKKSFSEIRRGFIAASLIPALFLTGLTVSKQHPKGSSSQTAISSSTKPIPPATLTPAERKMASALYFKSGKDLTAAIAGLTPAQLTFKPAPDRWSIQECIQHIASSETTLWAMVDNTLKKPANPEKRASIMVSDTALVKAVEDRTQRNKTFAELEPANSKFTNAADAMKGFETERAKHIVFIEKTDADLRNHVMELPMGTFDTYQFILLIGAHTERHTKQIEEVKGSTGYPK